MDQLIRIPLPDPAQPREAPSRRGVGVGTPMRPLFVGPENRVVEVVVHAILADATAQYNPLVVVGVSGSGKSHLVDGLAAAYAAQYPRRPVLCQPAVDFARELADAIDGQATDAFRRRWREARLVVLEDVTRLAGAPAAQRELVHTLDAALAADHQVIVTAPSPPGRWVRIEASLQSRLEAGLCIRLASPSEDVRRAILRDAAERRGLPLSETAAGALAAGARGSVREMLGALADLHAQQQIYGGELNVERVRDYLAEERGRRVVELRDIAAATARALGLPMGRLRGRSQQREAVSARGVAIYLARRRTTMSLEQIGQYFGGRDHTTILHSCRKTQELLRADTATQEILRSVEELLAPVVTEKGCPC